MRFLARALALILLCSCATAPRADSDEIQPTQPTAVPVVREGVPPDLGLRLGDMLVMDEVGSYCVTEHASNGSARSCANAEATRTPVEVASPPEQLSFEWGWGEAEAQLALCRGVSRQCDLEDQATISITEEWSPELAKGDHVLSAFLVFEGGTASYDWLLSVR